MTVTSGIALVQVCVTHIVVNSTNQFAKFTLFRQPFSNICADKSPEIEREKRNQQN